VIRPTPVTQADAAALSALIGAQLEGVTYHYLPPADGPSYAGDGDGSDGDLTAVVLDFSNRGRTTITWAMLGELEGLAILDEDEPYSGLADGVVDASHREAWGGHIGDSVISVGAAWQVSGDDCPESLWAVRLGFSTRSIVIALGIADPDLVYLPDELVVIFDQSLAASYRPRHVRDSSLGRPIESG
jgi:hypothetical protein